MISHFGAENAFCIVKYSTNPVFWNLANYFSFFKDIPGNSQANNVVVGTECFATLEHETLLWFGHGCSPNPTY